MKFLNIFSPRIISIFVISLSISCQTETKRESKAYVAEELRPAFNAGEEFREYWFSGQAEITSYKLSQARYGEVREGQAVLIYVSEDFLPDAQVKADQPGSLNVPVLKLNSTKDFNTGIYPYSIMQSTFYPIVNNGHAVKVSGSIQEWCGQAYTQINNRDMLHISSHSYFQGEADQNFTLEKAIMENELWTQLRIDPQSLPTGKIQIIPSLEFIRLKHIDLEAYEAFAKLESGRYEVDYPSLDRKLVIYFSQNFPHTIESWEETFISGYGQNARKLVTKATKMKRIKSDYWTKNRNRDQVLRDSLMLN